MASDTFKRILFGLVIFTVFSSLIITFIVTMGNNYGVSSNEIGDGALDVSLFDNSMENISSSSDSYRQRFESGNPVDVDDASGLFSIVGDMINLITTPFTLLGQILANIIGVPILYINVFLGLLGISLILAMWSLIKKGD